MSVNVLSTLLLCTRGTFVAILLDEAFWTIILEWTRKRKPLWQWSLAKRAKTACQSWRVAKYGGKTLALIKVGENSNVGMFWHSGVVVVFWHLIARQNEKRQTGGNVVIFNGFKRVLSDYVQRNCWNICFLFFFFLPLSLSVETSFRIQGRFRGSHKVSIAEQDELFSQAFCRVKFPMV